jgi:hypothetical protein
VSRKNRDAAAFPGRNARDHSPKPRLGVNIRHVATPRNAHSGRHPDPRQAAEITDDTPAQSLKTEAASAPSRGVGAFDQ